MQSRTNIYIYGVVTPADYHHQSYCGDKMTIAQLYQHIQSTGLHSFTRMMSAEKIDFVFQNQIVPLRSRAEAEEFVFCFCHVPQDILLGSHHAWALELGYVGRYGAGTPPALYLVYQLNNGYQRTFSKDRLKDALLSLRMNIDRVNTLTLRDTISQLSQEVRTAREGQRAQNAVDNTQQAPETTGTDTSAQPAQSSRVMMVQQRFNDTSAQHQANVARAIDLSMHAPARPANQLPERMPIKEVLAFCKTNKLYRFRMYDPTSNSSKVTYVDPFKAARIRAILDADASEITCGICMCAEGSFSCGQSGCAYRVCGNCFFTWYKSNPKCPGCRGDFIPVSARPSPHPSEPAMATGVVGDDDGEEEAE
jgi:hypothetical protein